MPSTTEPVAPAKTSEPTITVKLDDEYHHYVINAAEDDDRSPAKWLKRFIQSQISLEK